ncbi:MAG: hypothetical protein GY784_07885 [Gammaproteobacteria bacterium]|nr:hypothetical protein [Gammaproteobacteria bacterium]
MATVKPKYKLSEALSKLGNEKLTGTLICVNEKNLQGRVFVSNGNVVMARCRAHEGRKALEIIQKHPLTLLKFHNDKNLVSLVPGRIGAKTPGGDKSNTQGQQPANPRKSPANTSPADDLQSTLAYTAPMAAELRNILAEELAEQIGPLAEVLVSEIPENMLLADAIGTLSRDIGDHDLAHAFSEGVKARI